MSLVSVTAVQYSAVTQRIEGLAGHLHLVVPIQRLAVVDERVLENPGLCLFRFRATLYPCPDTAAERREMAIGVNTRIEDLQTVSALFYLYSRKLLQLQ